MRKVKHTVEVIHENPHCDMLLRVLAECSASVCLCLLVFALAREATEIAAFSPHRERDVPQVVKLGGDTVRI